MNVITQDKGIDEVIHHQDEVENLDIITSGPIPPMPSELLGSKKFEQLLEDLKVTYDYIFIDSPPVLSVTDASVLAAKVDGTILVVISFGETKVDAAKTAMKSLERVGAKMLGVVLSKAKVNKSGYYYYYHYDYEYSGETKKDRKKKKNKGKREQNDKGGVVDA